MEYFWDQWGLFNVTLIEMLYQVGGNLPRRKVKYRLKWGSNFDYNTRWTEFRNVENLLLGNPNQVSLSQPLPQFTAAFGKCVLCRVTKSRKFEKWDIIKSSYDNVTRTNWYIIIYKTKNKLKYNFKNVKYRGYWKNIYI